MSNTNTERRNEDKQGQTEKLESIIQTISQSPSIYTFKVAKNIIGMWDVWAAQRQLEEIAIGSRIAQVSS
ncbi:hypothetical protein TNCT_181401 [Trichonephila clavata]|uniref:Uncharacterized protein n=1 Tax=Trichonephila clavata TaxID=2740835 RepID=A0A8X6I1M8_TRICU|nr:hypothetical protein TNCT_181401 [Trichonephila clavata]